MLAYKPLLLSALLVFGLSGAAGAAGWHYYDPDCPIPLGGGKDGGAKSMKFVAMQPKKNIDRECAALPDIGPTIIALDAADSELREMNWDIRILRGGPEKEADPEADLVRKLPPEKHRNGMVNFDHDFKASDNYQLYVKLTSDDGFPVPISRSCFACGIDNALGLRAQLRHDAGVVGGVWSPDAKHHVDGVVTPVALTTLLDEAAFWLGALASGQGTPQPR